MADVNGVSKRLPPNMQKLLESTKHYRAKLPGDPEQPNTPTLRRYSHVASVKGAFRSSFGDFPSMRRSSEAESSKTDQNLSDSVFKPNLSLLPPSSPPPPPPPQADNADDVQNNCKIYTNNNNNNNYNTTTNNPVLDIISITNDNDSLVDRMTECVEERSISEFNSTPDYPDDPDPDPDPDIHNWMLKDRGPSLRSSSLTASSASILNLNETIGRKRSRFWKECYWTAERRGSISKGKAPSLSRGLVKSNSLGNCLESVSSTKFQKYVNEWESTKWMGDNRSSGRKRSSDTNSCCCCCSKTATGKLQHTDSTDLQAVDYSNATPALCSTTTENKDDDDAQKKMLSCGLTQQVRFRDIALEDQSAEAPESVQTMKFGSVSVTSEDQEFNSIDWRRASMRSNFSLRSSKSSQAMNRRGKRTWKTKALKSWTLDDVLSWLQAIGLHQLASILIGYDITGADVDAWDCSALTDLGIINEQLQVHVLNQLEELKRQQYSMKRRKSRPSSATPTCSLHDVIKSFGDCQILHVSCSLSSRDITVAETKHNILLVTRVRNFAPLMVGDGILEVDGVLALKMVAMDLTMIIAESKGSTIKFVVLREFDEEEFVDEMADSLSTSGSSGIGLAQPPNRYYYRNSFSRL